MSDQAVPPPPAERTWAQVADNALHYAAIAALVGAVGIFAWYGKVSTDLFVALITAAGGAVGLKMSASK